MATIDIRGWRITSDAEGWALGKPKTRLNKKKEHEIYLAQPTYYASLAAALQGLLQRELRESDAATVQEVLALIRQVEAEIMQAMLV